MLVSFFILGIFIYFQGPEYVLKKAREYTKNHFDIDFSIEQVNFINSQGVNFDKIWISQKNNLIKIDNIKVFAEINLALRKAEIFEISIDHPQVDLKLNFDGNSINPNPEPNSNGIQRLEKLLLNPPDYLKVDKLNITNLEMKLQIEKGAKSPIHQKIKLNLNGLNFYTQLKLSPLKVFMALKLEIDKGGSFEFEKNQDKINFILSNLFFESQISVQKKNSNSWIYNFSKFKFSTKLENIYLSKENFFKNKQKISEKLSPLDKVSKAESKQAEALPPSVPMRPQSRLWIKSRDLVYLLEADLFMRTDKFLNFLNPQIDNLDWNQSFKLNQIIGGGVNEFRFLPKSGSQIAIENKSHIQSAQATPKRFDLPWSWNVIINITGGPFLLGSQKIKINALVNNYETQGSFSVKVFPKSLLSFSGNSNFRKEQLQFDGTLLANIPLNISENIFQQKLDGQVKIPLHLLVNSKDKDNSNKISFETLLEFTDFNFEKDQLKVIGINGQIPIHEEVHFNRSKQGLSALRFQTTLLENPFERADYDRLEPYVRESDFFKIKNFIWDNKKFGPFKGVVDIRQNMISINRFSFDLGQGSIGGESFLDINLEKERFGFLGRFTQLNLFEILPEKFLKGVSKHQKLPFSGRLGLIFLRKNRSLNGRVDITEVASPQLFTLINIIDQNSENEKLNKVRGLLQYGYPTYVGMGFNEGYLDLDIDIHSLGINTRQGITGVSIQSIIDKAFEAKESLASQLQKD